VNCLAFILNVVFLPVFQKVLLFQTCAETLPLENGESYTETFLAVRGDNLTHIAAQQ
jgi:hypothetical protein